MLLCCICAEATGIFTCRGCDRDFCIEHVTKHGHLLTERLKNIIFENDQLRQNMKIKLDGELLMKQIDEWEKTSIEKVRQAAVDARKQLLNVCNKHSAEMTKILKPFDQELVEAGEKYDLAEPNLHAWSAKLEEMKKMLNALPKISIVQDYDKTPFIQQVIVLETVDELFQKSVGNIRSGDNGKTITHGCFSAFGAGSSRGVYSDGCQRFRFEINSFSGIGLIFLGINSQSASMKANSLFASTAYGWTGENNITPNEIKGARPWNYIKDIKMNDIFEMIVNCNRQAIWLKNERTNEEYELDVDLNICPFPWQLYFCLSYWRDSIRFLST